MFKNKHGHAPSAPLAPDSPHPPAPPHRHPRLRGRDRVVSPFIVRLGHEPIDTERCQGPVNSKRCENPAVCVVVENKPRPNGLIAALALCEFHRDVMLRNQGPDYAHITPLGSRPSASGDISETTQAEDA